MARDERVQCRPCFIVYVELVWGGLLSNKGKANLHPPVVRHVLPYFLRSARCRTLNGR